MKTKRDLLQDGFSKEFMDKGFKGIMYLCPRFGKIKTTINCLKEKDKVIIAYPEVSIKKSWTGDFKKWKFKGKDINYTTYMSFKKLKGPCDVLVLDEVHLISPAQMIHIANYINNNAIEKVIALTGTLAEDTEKNLLEVLRLPVLVKYSIDEAIRDGVVTDYRIEVRTIPLSTVKDTKVKWVGGEFMTSEKQSFDHISNKIEYEQNPIKRKMLRLNRMNIIKKSKAKVNLTKNILEEFKNKRVLVFTGLTEVADSLGIDSFHSKNKDVDKALSFISGKTDKLAVVKQLNTGVTFKSLDTAVINFFDSNSENMAQRISRITCLEYNNKEKIANIIIVSSNEQVELGWLNKALSFFDSKKIKFI